MSVTALLITEVVPKNCASFTRSITKVDGTTIDDTEDLYLVMVVYNLIEYSWNYSEQTGRLWFYSKGKATSFNNNNENINDFKCFKYKVK